MKNLANLFFLMLIITFSNLSIEAQKRPGANFKLEEVWFFGPCHMPYDLGDESGSYYQCNNPNVLLMGASPDVCLFESRKFITLPNLTLNQYYTYFYISPVNCYNVDDEEKTYTEFIDNICLKEVRIKGGAAEEIKNEE